MSGGEVLAGNCFATSNPPWQHLWHALNSPSGKRGLACFTTGGVSKGPVPMNQTLLLRKALGSGS